jgi:tetratricopeptide (TPR) repeat protein
MRSNYLWLIAALLLTGCAGTPNSVDVDNNLQKKAEQDAQAEIDARNPDMSAAINALNDGKPVVAKALLLGLTQRFPLAAKPWINVGLISVRRGELDRAQQAAEKALELQPEITVAEYLLGLIAHKKNDAPKALTHYLAELEKNEQHAYSHYNLALLYDTYYQDLDKAVFHYRRYLSLIPDEDETTLSWVKELESQLVPDGGDDAS